MAKPTPSLFPALTNVAMAASRYRLLVIPDWGDDEERDAAEMLDHALEELRVLMEKA